MIYPIKEIQFNNKKEVKGLEVKILNLTDEKIVKITVYNFNPDSSFWRKIAIFLGSNRRVIPISLENQQTPVYVKIQEVAKILKMNEKEFRQEINKKHIHNPSYINNLIKELYAVNLIKAFQPSAQRGVIRKNLTDAIDAQKKDGKQSLADNLIDKYCQDILDNLNKPAKKEVRKSKNKNIRKKPGTASAKSLANPRPKPISPKPPLQENTFESFVDFLNSANISLKANPNNRLNLSTVATRISYNTMARLIATQRTPKEKQDILQALLSSGKTIRVNQEQLSLNPIRVKRNKDADTYAFTITKDHIFIELPVANAANILGKGASKIVSTAIKIDNYNPMEFINPQVEKVARLKPYGETSRQIQFAQLGMEEEVKVTARFENSKHIVHGYTCQVWSQTKATNTQSPIDTLVLFQPIYINGKKLLNQNTPLFHKLNALIGIGKGIVEVHEKGYVHMDIKPNNCLLSGDISGKTPIQGFVTDLGLAVELGKPLAGGTIDYLPPESLITYEIGGGELDFKTIGKATNEIDSFSFGMTILASLTGNNIPPIDESGIPIGLCKNKAVFDQKMQNYFDKLKTEWNDKSNPEHRAKRRILTICNQLMQYNPEERISCEKAVKRLERLQPKLTK